MIRGRIFNVQRFSVHDGPGIRTTVFLKGCPLRCAWCHNPESLRGEAELTVAESRCIHCGACIEACPTGRLGVLGEGGPSHWAPEALRAAPECTLCGTCVAACPTEARQLVGRLVGVDELVADLLEDRLFFDESGGGVTFSGGEPLAQPEFLAAALDACRRQGLRTAVDTSGFCRREDLLDMAGRTDLFLYDLKHMDEDRHRELTGVSNRRILDNLRALAHVRAHALIGSRARDRDLPLVKARDAAHDAIWIRVPLIPGVNDDAANLEATARFVRSLPGVHRLHLLPYHVHGIDKRDRLTEPLAPERRIGSANPAGAAESADAGDRSRQTALDLAARRLTAAGLEVHLGG